ncbi:hypothetical protein LOD99_15403 [Oopsacas minuta]|uniref:Uncharacterized protein n=1 Tax=Oopsacas minuta TaxID=111878 RepID=A0AAV7KBP1_9METZ|nr:hypothetical protein LOD99_15403 [Oopsacas minuta]
MEFFIRNLNTEVSQQAVLTNADTFMMDTEFWGRTNPPNLDILVSMQKEDCFPTNNQTSLTTEHRYRHPDFQLFSTLSYLPHSVAITPAVIYPPQIITSISSIPEIVSSPTHIVSIQTQQMESNPPPNTSTTALGNLKDLCSAMTNQGNTFVNTMDEIVWFSQLHCQAHNPEEVMKFYQSLPKEKKVTKYQRTKYRKYSLVTEYEKFKKSHKQS